MNDDTIVVTNTPRAGESEEQTLSRSEEGRRVLNERLTTAKPGGVTSVSLEELKDFHKSDPAPDPVEAARQRAADFVHNICTQAQLSLRERRDEIDNLTARMSNSERALVSYIGEFAKFSAEVLAMSTSIKSEIDHATLPFKADPPATITQLKSNGGSNAKD